jgi:microcystin-dependent protein
MDPYLGQISITAFDYAPKGWMLCNGQTLAIAQNQALFSLLGTMYGGNGMTTFNLPDLRGRAATAASPQAPTGAAGGVENVTLLPQNLPSLAHVPLAVAAAGTQAGAAGAMWAGSNKSDNQYLKAGTANVAMSPAAIAGGGGNQAHPNMPPMTVVSFIIAVSGIFPSRN